MPMITKDVTGQLQIARTLAIQVNPVPFITHKMKVVKPLRLADESLPEGVDKATWKIVLDGWDADASHALGRGAVYIVGDVVEVNRFEAGDLLKVVPSYFEPADKLTKRLAEVIAAGTIETSGGQG